MQQEASTEKQEAPKLEITGSRGFHAFMETHKISILFSTYQTGKFFLIGSNQKENKLSIFERTFNRCMGLAVSDDMNRFYMSTIYQMWLMENSIPQGETYNGYDKMYVPQVAYTTGDIDVHDIIIDEQGRPIFINTLFSCIATVSERYSFRPLWKPKFISKLAAEDRCHLNGLAAVNHKPKYVSVVAESDVHEGWREHRRDGGQIIDIDTNEVLCHGLSMPHSPRFYRDKIWLHNSGEGYFGYVDSKTGKFEPITFCPGYARGLAFIGDYALIGLSKIRNNKTFAELKLSQELQKKGITARCGILVIDIRNGDIVHSLKIEGIVEELYDIQLLRNVIRPMAIGTVSQEIHQIISVDDEGFELAT